MKISIIFLLFFLVPFFLSGQNLIKKEIIEARTQNSKKFEIKQNRFQIELSSVPLHYQDETGIYHKIDLNWVKNGENYYNNKNTFITDVHTDFIQVTNRKTKEKITISTFSLNKDRLAFNSIRKISDTELALQASKYFKLGITNKGGI